MVSIPLEDPASAGSAAKVASEPGVAADDGDDVAVATAVGAVVAAASAGLLGTTSAGWLPHPARAMTASSNTLITETVQIADSFFKPHSLQFR